MRSCLNAGIDVVLLVRKSSECRDDPRDVLGGDSVEKVDSGDCIEGRESAVARDRFPLSGRRRTTAAFLDSKALLISNCHIGRSISRPRGNMLRYGARAGSVCGLQFQSIAVAINEVLRQGNDCVAVVLEIASRRGCLQAEVDHPCYPRLLSYFRTTPAAGVHVAHNIVACQRNGAAVSIRRLSY